MNDPIKDEAENEANKINCHDSEGRHFICSEIRRQISQSIERHLREKEELRKKVEEYESKLSGWIDITREKELEEKLKASQDKLKIAYGFLDWLIEEIFEGSPDGGDIQDKLNECGLLVICKVDRTDERYSEKCEEYDTDELLFPAWSEEALKQIEGGK